MQDGALDHPLETERGLRVHLVTGNHGSVFADEVGEQLAQLLDIRCAGTQHLGRRRVVQQREKQVLHGDELVALLPCIHESHVQADFELLRDHNDPLDDDDYYFTTEYVWLYHQMLYGPPHTHLEPNQISSIRHCNGCSCLREKAITCSTLVAAISLGYTPHTPIPSRCTLSIT